MKSLDKIKKAPWLVAIALGLGLSCASSGFGFAVGTENNKATTPAPAVVKEHKKAPSFLFVVSADKAKITHLKDGQYSLVIQKSDMNRVIEFSDRPYRIVKYITGSELQKIWGGGKKGKNSFAVDPPNAVLSAANQKPVIVVLDGMQVDKDQVTFTLSSTHVLSVGIFNKLSVTADDYLKNVCCTKPCNKLCYTTY